jgi:hypothetical protein
MGGGGWVVSTLISLISVLTPASGDQEPEPPPPKLPSKAAPVWLLVEEEPEVETDTDTLDEALASALATPEADE